MMFSRSLQDYCREFRFGPKTFSDYSSPRQIFYTKHNSSSKAAGNLRLGKSQRQQHPIRKVYNRRSMWPRSFISLNRLMYLQYTYTRKSAKAANTVLFCACVALGGACLPRRWEKCARTSCIHDKGNLYLSVLSAKSPSGAAFFSERHEIGVQPVDGLPETIMVILRLVPILAYVGSTFLGKSALVLISEKILIIGLECFFHDGF